MNIDDFYVKSKRHFAPKQRLWFFALCLYSFYIPFHMVQVVFTGLMPEFTCDVGNQTLVDKCGRNGKCDNFTYTLGGSDSFLKNWPGTGTPCQALWIAKLVQFCFTFGILLGAPLLGRCGDYYGRKNTLLYCLIAMIVVTTASSLVPDLWMHALCRFIEGFFSAGNLSAAFVLSMELVGPNMRGICGNIFQAFFGLGIMGLSGLAYLVRSDWRILSLCCGLVGLILIPVGVMIPESPRWLFAKGRDEEGISTLHYLTGVPTEDIPLPQKHEDRVPNTLSILHFIRLKLLIFAILLLSWFTNSIVYYALTLSNSGTLSVYVGTAISGCVEIPAYAFTAILIDRIGRRITLAAFMIIAGISCILSVFTTWTYISLVGKLCIAASFSIIYIHSNEIFPTVVRTVGIGMCSSFARVGGLAASAFLHREAGSYNIAYLGGMSIFSGLLNILLPETLNAIMPETLEELDVKGIYSRKYARLLPNDDYLSEGEGDEDIVYERSDN